MAPKKATKGAVKVPAVPKPSKTFVAGQREKHAGGHVDVGAEALALAANLVHGSASAAAHRDEASRRVPRLVQAEEVEKVRAELVKVPENCLEMQPVVTAAAAPLADGLGPVVKEAFGPGAKVKQMRLKSGVRTEEAKKSEDNIMKLIELITQGGSFDYTFEEDLSIPIVGNEQIDNIVVEAGTSIAIAVESTPIKQKVPILGTIIRTHSKKNEEPPIDRSLGTSFDGNSRPFHSLNDRPHREAQIRPEPVPDRGRL